MAKIRSHNEWFKAISLGNRKSCPNCKCKLENGESIWAWGEYVRARWNTVKYFCKNCFEKEVQKPLADHAGSCGCEINLCGRGDKLPEWLHMPEECKV